MDSVAGGAATVTELTPLGRVDLFPAGTAVSCVKFDAHEELVWVGSQTGYCASVHAPSLTKYTSFRAAGIAADPSTAARRGQPLVYRPTPVSDLLISEESVFALSDEALKATRKNGVSLFLWTTPEMRDQQSFAPTASGQLVMAGKSLILGDVEVPASTDDTLTVTQIRISDQGWVAAADSQGQVALRAANSLDVLHSFAAHPGAVLDMDVIGSTLVTVGMSFRAGSLVGDTFVKAYDLRARRALPPRGLAFAPRFVRFVSLFYDSRFAAVASHGQTSIASLEAHDAAQVVLPFASDMPVTGFDVSTTRQVFAYGDQLGRLGLCTSSAQPAINHNSWSTHFADAPILEQSFLIEDQSTSLASVALPRPGAEFPTELCSDVWPESFATRAYRAPVRCPPAPALRNAIQFVAYAPNPHAALKRANNNICPYDEDGNDGDSPDALRLALAADEQERGGSGSQSIAIQTSSTAQMSGALAAAKPNEPNALVATVMPVIYRRPMVRRPPRAAYFDEIDWTRYNETDDVVVLEQLLHQPSQGGQQNLAVYLAQHIGPVAQLLFWTRPVRKACLEHVCTSAKEEKEEHCLVCQLGFLYRMLEDRTTARPASAANLYRSLRLHPAAAGISNEGGGGTGTAQILHRMTEMLLKQIDERVADNATLHELVALTCERQARCVRCDKTSTTSETLLTLELSYPNQGGSLTWAALVEQSLNLRAVDEARDCSACSLPTRHALSRRPQKVAPILTLDATPGGAKHAAFWLSQLQVLCDKSNGENDAYSNSSVVHHIDRRKTLGRVDSAQPATPSRKTMDMSQGEKQDTDAWAHYVAADIYVRLRAGGGAAVTEAPPLDDSLSASDNAPVHYELVAMLCAVGDAQQQQQHGAVLVRKPIEKRPVDADEPATWVLINDFAVTQLSENEALHLHPRWKLPVILIYAQADKTEELLAEGEERLSRADVPATVFEEERVKLDELPTAGDEVGIDAEFIHLHRKDGVPEGGGDAAKDDVENDGSPKVLLDDYVAVCVGDHVHDYLTQWSGIEEHDLDPLRTTKHLTTLKKVYLKILHLIQRGVILVGHALTNDFSALNLHVPEEQTRDTALLFQLPGQRMLSLQFLAYHVLGEKIQEGTHCSLEDARVALRLYGRYKELKKSGELAAKLEELYTIGKMTQFRLPGGSKSVSPNKPEPSVAATAAATATAAPAATQLT